MCKLLNYGFGRGTTFNTPLPANFVCNDGGVNSLRYVNLPLFMDI